MPYAPRYLRPLAPITLRGRALKRYALTLDERPIEPVVLSAVEAFAAKLVPSPDHEGPPAGFLVIHRTERATFVNAYSWVWTNVLHCQAAAAGEPVLGCPDASPANFMVLTRPLIGCVWELAPLDHERGAWIRHVLAPATPRVELYLADVARAGLTDPLLR